MTLCQTGPKAPKVLRFCWMASLEKNLTFDNLCRHNKSFGLSIGVLCVLDAKSFTAADCLFFF